MLKTYEMPSVILGLFDLPTLKIEPSVIVKGSEVRTDLMLSIRLKNSKKQARIILILDHKSWPDKSAIQQLLKYQLKIVDEQSDDGPILPLVFTIIFYHGHKKWVTSSSLHEDWISKGILSKEEFEKISPYLINFKPYIFDLSKFDIEKKAINNIKPVLYAFQNVWFFNKFKSKAEKKVIFQKILSSVKKDLQGEEKEYIINVLLGIKSYLLQYNPELREGLLDEVSKEVTKELGGENIMKELDLTVAEIVQKNCQEWKQEGIKEVVLKFLDADMSVEKVSRITGFSKEKIRKFQER